MARPPSNRTSAARRRRRDALIVKAGAREALLTAAEAGALAGGMSEQNFPAYSARWPALRAGMRIVRVGGPASRGRARWLLSALVEHIREELLRPELDGQTNEERMPRRNAAREQK